MKRYLKLILIVLPLTLFSCNKWLNVEPESQVRDTYLFSTESGFKEALAGVYASLTYEPLYGREMTFGLIGVLGYEWDSQASAYDFDKVYDYRISASLIRIDAIWNGMYTSIANDNKLLEEIDAKKSVFKGDNYYVIKGEALALRAFLHFDLLRVFGASYQENPQKIAIPYYKKTGSEIAPQLSVADVLDLAITDLKEAAELLNNVDPVNSGRTITTLDDNGYLLNRQVHLNYYAVQGLLARIYLYKKDYSNAQKCAEIVIESNKFPWIQPNALADKTRADLTFSTEHLFALNVIRLKTINDASFVTVGNALFSATFTTRTEYYQNETSDYRYLNWFDFNSSATNYFNKYTQLEGSGWPQAYRNKIPMIKLAEMYFIAAEAQRNTNITAAASLINEVRIHRGLSPTTINEANFDSVLLLEFRKEFIGEGQLFFFHKRKNNASIPRAAGLNLITLKGYKLPIPVSEFNNAPGRVDNR